MLLKALTEPKVLADFQSILTEESLKKGHLLHREGAICRRLYLIKKGLARAYYYRDGKDITAHFASEGGSITAIDSFIQKKRSRYTNESFLINVKEMMAYRTLCL